MCLPPSKPPQSVSFYDFYIPTCFTNVSVQHQMIFFSLSTRRTTFHRRLADLTTASTEWFCLASSLIHGRLSVPISHQGNNVCLGMRTPWPNIYISIIYFCYQETDEQYKIFLLACIKFEGLAAFVILLLGIAALLMRLCFCHFFKTLSE